MQISNKYIVVEKLEEEAKEGFKTVEVQDNFVYKGKVLQGGFDSITICPRPGNIILFAKYSPDTHEIDLDGKKVKFVCINDVLAVL